MNTPKISVITPSYNQGAYIERTIDSVLSQGYPNLEFIIIDGGSSDNTVDVIKKYERHLTYWISEADRGQSHAINKGAGRATGEYLTWLNSDDWYVNDALSSFIDTFAANPNAGAVVGRGQIVDAAGVVLQDKSPSAEIDFDFLCGWISGDYFMQPSCLLSRSAWAAVGGVREDIHFAMDLDLWLRVTKAGFRFAITDRLLSVSLSHADAKTTALAFESQLDAARVISSHGSVRGYESIIELKIQSEKNLRHKLGWYERNYNVVVNHPLLRMLQPLVKRFSTDGRYWQGSVPSWKD
jgi:glycosyltransferase involved in cell wall biosynthesis